MVRPRQWVRFVPFWTPHRFHISLPNIAAFPYRALPVIICLLAAAGRAPAADATVGTVNGDTLLVELLDADLEFRTPHGVLRVKTADVRSVQFATRRCAADEEKVTNLIRSLADPSFETREAASKSLVALGAVGYPVLLKHKNDPDAEVKGRVEECVKRIRAAVPLDKLRIVKRDVLKTDDSSISGEFTAAHLKIRTKQFGEQELKLCDVAYLRLAGVDPGAGVEEAPVNLTRYANQYGEELVFRVTGMNNAGGGHTIWGTDTYSLDSEIAVAAVHAGAVEAGRTAVVKVRIVRSPDKFEASWKNNVSSLPFGKYESGAYVFVGP